MKEEFFLIDLKLNAKNLKQNRIKNIFLDLLFRYLLMWDLFKMTARFPGI